MTIPIKAPVSVPGAAMRNMRKALKPGDLVMTAGLQQGKLPSFYPTGIPIGLVTKVGQTDIDQFQDVQVMPLVDFSSLEAVVVLVSNKPRPRMP